MHRLILSIRTIASAIILPLPMGVGVGGGGGGGGGEQTIIDLRQGIQGHGTQSTIPGLNCQWIDNSQN